MFLALCDPSRDSLEVSASEQEWENISFLARLHGVTSFLFYRTRQLGISVPEEIKKEWLGIYLYSLAQDQKARRQIKELKEILEPEGIPFILLKGASAMLRLYPQPGLRTFCDIDILIPPEKADLFKKTMAAAGYEPISARNSPEDEELLKFDSHLDPLCKNGSIAIECHLNILGAKGDHSIINPEIWQEREEANTDGPVSHLNGEHFIIHTLLHFSKHLSNEGFSEIKWFIDLLYAIKAGNIDWTRLWSTARKWAIEKEILPIIATLNLYWQTQIPAPKEVAPLDPETVVFGTKDQEKHFYAELPTRYVDRLLKFRRLPDTSSQVRYLFRLFFPARENLRYRYDLSSRWSIIFYYFVHITYTFKKFFTGLWYQILFHPKTIE